MKRKKRMIKECNLTFLYPVLLWTIMFIAPFKLSVLICSPEYKFIMLYYFFFFTVSIYFHLNELINKVTSIMNNISTLMRHSNTSYTQPSNIPFSTKMTCFYFLLALGIRNILYFSKNEQQQKYIWNKTCPIFWILFYEACQFSKDENKHNFVGKFILINDGNWEADVNEWEGVENYVVYNCIEILIAPFSAKKSRKISGKKWYCVLKSDILCFFLSIRRHDLKLKKKHNITF